MKQVFPVLVLALLLSACMPTQEQQPTIGVILHFTAEGYGPVAYAMQEGIDMAVAEQNAAGGINGQAVRVIYEDDGYDMKRAYSAANKLVNIDHVDAALISTYTEVMTVGPFFEQQHVPLVNMWDSSPHIDNLGDYIFGTGAWTPAVATRIADYAYDDLHLRRIAIVHQDAEWSATIAQYFTDRFTERGGVIVTKESLLESDSDFRTVITKIQNENTDGIFAPLGTHLDAFFMQLQAREYSGQILAADSLTQDFIDAANGAAEGVHYTSLKMPSTPEATMFAQKYREQYGKDSDLLLFVGLGYDGAKAIMHAMQEKGTTPEQIKEGLYAIRDMPGSFEPLTMHENGSAPRYEKIYVVKDGKETFVKN
jgi:branched-chain amino acid transport system substrate-binding protein